MQVTGEAVGGPQPEPVHRPHGSPHDDRGDSPPLEVVDAEHSLEKLEHRHGRHDQRRGERDVQIGRPRQRGALTDVVPQATAREPQKERVRGSGHEREREPEGECRSLLLGPARSQERAADHRGTDRNEGQGHEHEAVDEEAADRGGAIDLDLVTSCSSTTQQTDDGPCNRPEERQLNQKAQNLGQHLHDASLVGCETACTSIVAPIAGAIHRPSACNQVRRPGSIQKRRVAPEDLLLFPPSWAHRMIEA